MKAPYVKEGKQFDWYLSRAGHVKPGLNLGGPPSKATYSSMTDRGGVAKASLIRAT